MSIKTITWIKSTLFEGKRIIDRWSVPQNDLNKSTIFWGRLVGNFPEFMLLDNSLNQDIIMSHRYHYVITYHSTDEEDRTFSLRSSQ